MNISSSFHASPIVTTNRGNIHTSTILRLGQTHIENPDSVIQPVTEPAEPNKLRTVPINKIGTEAITEAIVVANNSTSPNKRFANNDLVDNNVQQATISNGQETQQNSLESQKIQELRSRDREVRNHERAHAAVGGQYTGSPRYSFERGPDGINYALEGELAISTGLISGNPKATIQKAQIIRQAALAPTEPSVQDRKIAAQAVQLEAKARIELQNLQLQERIEQEELGEARTARREDSLLLLRDPLFVGVNDVDLVQSNTRQNTAKEIVAITADNQRVLDKLTLRIRQTDPFGIPKPGQILSQFI